MFGLMTILRIQLVIFPSIGMTIYLANITGFSKKHLSL